jgi:hypothetical protein
MEKIARFFLLSILVLLLNSCDEWDDLVDSISGSGDDKPAPVEEVVVAKAEVVKTPSPAPAPAPVPRSTSYETRFHHTTTGSSDGGKSLVLCPGQVMNFNKCSVGNVIIPEHGRDNGRVIYWNMYEVPSGDIICVKNGKAYKYKANKTVLYGDC